MKRAVSYYAGPEDADFSARTPEEYLASLFEDVPDAELEAEVRRRGHVVVVVERRPRKVQSSWVRFMAMNVWHYIVEEFDAEYGGAHGAKRAPRNVVRELSGVIERIIARHLCAYWCEEVARRAWTPDEVLRVLRRRRARRSRREREGR
jgi:hypothetical protein